MTVFLYAMPQIRLLKMLALLLVAFFLSACASDDQVNGQLPSPERIAMIEPGVSSRDDVLELLGSPSTRPPFDDDNWYYIRKISRMVAFFDPVVLEQNILTIVFNDDGIVDDILLYTQKDGRDIAMAERITPTQGRELTIWEQILSNYGNIGAAGAATPNR